MDTRLEPPNEYTLILVVDDSGMVTSATENKVPIEELTGARLTTFRAGHAACCWRKVAGRWVCKPEFCHSSATDSSGA